ncbi:protein transporter Sec31 [Streptomyces sp. NPDC014779]|uniref:protein transporter Sec31 n=1 Tax=Streptomyces sp. NPDC014779 TaxID=3364911 RepID=UPI0036FD8D0B
MRTRTIVDTRRVPHTVDGETLLITEEHTRQIPVPPRDWDHIVWTGALGLIIVGLGIVIVWSTSSIGQLLVRTDIAAPIAFAAATGFSLGWIVCMALEWLARYDPVQIRHPRAAGHVFLAADMAAVCVHGWVADSLKVGIIGAVLSGGAKALWTLALDRQAAPLSARDQQWVMAKRAQIGSRLALGAVRRQLTRAEARAADEEAALRARSDADPDGPDESEDEPDADILPLPPGATTAKDAVRTAWEAGFRDEDKIRRTASKALGRPLSPDTVARYVRALKVGA